MTGYFADMKGQQVIGHKDENNLTSTILSMAHDLIHFGFFGSENQIKLFLDTVVNALDGRNDVFDDNDSTTHRLSLAAKEKEVDFLVEGGGSSPMMKQIAARGSGVQNTKFIVVSGALPAQNTLQDFYALTNHHLSGLDQAYGDRFVAPRDELKLPSGDGRRRARSLFEDTLHPSHLFTPPIPLSSPPCSHRVCGSGLQNEHFENTRERH